MPRDWTRMTAADFDADAEDPEVLDVDGVGPMVPAVPDDCGTEPLFGLRKPSRRAPAAPGETSAPFPQEERLF